MGGVDERGVQVEPAGGAQLGQQPLVQLLPDPDGLPVPQSPPAGHPRAAERRWEIPPGHPGPQDEHDPGQRGSVVHRPATWIAEPTWPGRAQRCQPPPQLVGEHVVQHPTPPTAQRSPGVRPTRARCETRSKPYYTACSLIYLPYLPFKVTTRAPARGWSGSLGSDDP